MKESHAQKLESSIVDKFSSEIDKNILHIIRPPEGWYAPIRDPCALTNTPYVNDSLLRVLWRSKQCLDFAYLFSVASENCIWYLQLEDDTPAYTFLNWTQEVLRFAKGFEDKENLGLLRFFRSDPFPDGDIINVDKLAGMIGLLLPAKHMSNLSNYFLRYFNEEPPDWLLGKYLISQNTTSFVHKPDVFAHEGFLSSKQKVIEWEEARRLEMEAKQLALLANLTTTTGHAINDTDDATSTSGSSTKGKRRRRKHERKEKPRGRHAMQVVDEIEEGEEEAKEGEEEPKGGEEVGEEQLRPQPWPFLPQILPPPALPVHHHSDEHLENDLGEKIPRSWEECKEAKGRSDGGAKEEEEVEVVEKDADLAPT